MEISERVCMTPEKAMELLSKNTRNRKSTKTLIKDYARTMVRGEWKYNPQPIIVGESGILIDGQHRLMAIVESGVSVDVQLVTNMQEVQDNIRTADIIDVGKPRRVGDQLAIEHDIADGRRIAACAVVLSYICLGVTHKITVQVALSIYEQFKDAMDLTLKKTMGTWFEKKSKIIGPLVFCVHVDSCYNEFVDGIITGASLCENSPILMCRNYLMRIEKWEYPLVHKIFQAARLYHEGKTIKRISYVSDSGTKWFRRKYPDVIKNIEELFS